MRGGEYPLSPTLSLREREYKAPLPEGEGAVRSILYPLSHRERVGERGYFPPF
jgi:hypothetical protein